MVRGTARSIGMLGALLLLGAASPVEPVRYTLTPVFDDGSLSAVAVELTLRADPSGRTVLELPDGYGGEKEHWRYLSPVEVVGGSVSTISPSEREVRSAPNAALTIRYRVRTAYLSDPDAAGGNAYKGAAIRPTWFASLGNFLFATPRGRDDAPARFAWSGWPHRWTKASSLDARPITVNDVAESNFLAGPDVTLRTRPIQGGMLRLASHGRFGWSVDGYADKVAAVVSAQRRFWGEADGDYTVTLFQLAPSGSRTSTGGTGRAHGFVLYASAASDADTLFRLIAHEHVHNWVPNRLGDSPEESGASLFWLTEGFTDFYTARTLSVAGLWTPEQFAADLNRALAAVASLPAGAYPNSRVASDFWTDPAAGQLPYDRGHLFAHLLDAELRRGGKPGLDTVMFAMRDRWAAAPAKAKPPILDNLLAVLDARGFDVRPLLAKHIDAGADILLPSDLLGRCASISTTTIPTFDPGFDRDASAKTGAFAGVDPSGPAYAAGLRDGMSRVARVSGQEGDSRVPLRYRIRDASGERVIGWLPAGKGRLTLQEVRPNADAPRNCMGSPHGVGRSATALRSSMAT
ncbi:hypothetical protein [uncultured Sphingomonas sp.]|uniref:M61 family metallopeptidase n=1 Tax=uncultured Sphingomonas sp. TaxID=158754 RepID=UPI0035C9DE38